MAQPSKPLKSGDFAVSVAEDPVLWTDRKRVLGLPLSFTRYSLTANKLVLNTGFMSLHEEEVRLYRVRDISLTRTLGERLFGVGTLRVQSSDASVPVVEIRHVKHPQKVKAVLSQCIEDCRVRNGIRTSEVLGGGPAPHPHEPGDGCPEPGVFPDQNQNGVERGRGFVPAGSPGVFSSEKARLSHGFSLTPPPASSIILGCIVKPSPHPAQTRPVSGDPS